MAAPPAPADAVGSSAAASPPAVLERIDATAATRMGRGELGRRLTALVDELLAEAGLLLNGAERQQLVTTLLDDMVGLGPLEPLLADDSVTDIMVNGPSRSTSSARGKLELTDVRFRDDAHVMARRHAHRHRGRPPRRRSRRRWSTPASPDGSRVNIIIPPLAIDGPTISIRKFAKKEITLDVHGAAGQHLRRRWRRC